MRIPYESLAAATFRAVVEELTSRDGTDNSPLEQRIEVVLTQFEAGEPELHYDVETMSCNILPAR